MLYYYKQIIMEIKLRRKLIMKKSIFALFAISMTMFAAGETKKVHEKTAKLQKDSY